MTNLRIIGAILGLLCAGAMALVLLANWLGSEWDDRNGGGE